MDLYYDEDRRKGNPHIMTYILMDEIRYNGIEKARQLIQDNDLCTSSWSYGYYLLCDVLNRRYATLANLLLQNKGCKVIIKTKNNFDTPLHFAAAMGDVQIVRLILDKGANVNARNQFAITPLHCAVEGKNLKVAELLLKNKASVDARSKDGMSALHIASKNGCLQIVELLLKYKASTHFESSRKENNGYTPLLCAVESGNLEIVIMLLRSGAIVNIKEMNDINVIHIASKLGHTSVVEFFVHLLGRVNKSSLKDGYTPLHYACEHGHTETCSLLIKEGANINICTNNERNETPLHIATRNAHETVVDLLLQHGAEVDSLNSESRTPLNLSIENGNLAIVESILKYSKYLNNENNRNSINLALQGLEKSHLKIIDCLLEYGFMVDTEDINKSELLCNAINKGFHTIIEVILKSSPNAYNLVNSTYLDSTPLHYATLERQEEIIKLLLSYDANVNIQAGDGKPSIFYAVEYGKLNIINMFLQHGADINIRDNNGRTALHYTVISRCFDAYNVNQKIRCEVVKLLLSKGADVDAKTVYGETTLHKAIDQNYEKVVAALLENKANANTPNDNGDTPIYLSVQLGNTKLIKMLVKSGADVNVRNKNGTSPILCAMEKKYFEIVILLLAYGANVDFNPNLLIMAVQRRCLKVVKSLLQHGANVNSKDKYGTTALHLTGVKKRKFSGLPTHVTDKKYLSIQSDKVYETIHDIYRANNVRVAAVLYFRNKHSLDCHIKASIANLLLNNGAIIDVQTNDGATALHIAIEENNENVFDVLLAHKANVNICALSNITPLHLAAAKEEDYMTKRLLEKGAYVNVMQKGDITPLHIATIFGNSSVVKVLLEHGAKVDAQTKDSFIRTPLQLASRHGYTAIINMLLQFGANTESVDSCGRTALHMACDRGYNEAVATLLDHCADINVECINNKIPLDYIIDHPEKNYYRNIGVDDYVVNVPDPSLNEPTPTQVVHTLKRHIVKLMSANLYVNERNLQFLYGRDEESEFKCKCEEEINNMKCEIISHDISFYDILSRDITFVAKCIKNENIKQALNSQHYKTQFPMYGTILHNYIRKAMKRNNLLEYGSKALHYFFRDLPELPYDCIESILSYLRDKDLHILKDAYEPDSSDCLVD